jgi:hypothetical protein
MIARVDWTFTPRLSLQLFLQPLISAGDFTELKEFVRPRTYDFAIYGRDKGTATATSDGTEIDPGDGGATFTVPQQNFTVRSLRATRCCAGSGGRARPSSSSGSRTGRTTSRSEICGWAGMWTRCSPGGIAERGGGEGQLLAELVDGRTGGKAVRRFGRGRRSSPRADPAIPVTRPAALSG